MRNLKIFSLLILILIFFLSNARGKGGSGGRGGSKGIGELGGYAGSDNSNSMVKYPWDTGHRSWHEYGTSGHIHGFVWYIGTRNYRDDPYKEPTICRNEFDYVMDNGTHYKWFICPSEDLTSDFKNCCGQEDKQYCCDSCSWKYTGIVLLGVMALLSTLVGCYYFTCGEKGLTVKTYFQKMFNRKISTRADESVQLNPLEMPGQPQSELAHKPKSELVREYPLQFQPAHEYPAQLQPAPMYPLHPQPMPMAQPEFPISNSKYMPGMPPAGPGMSTGVSGILPYSVEGLASTPPCTPFHTLPTSRRCSHCIAILDSKPLDSFYPHPGELPSDSPYLIGPISSVPRYLSCPPPYGQL